jgi:hypothetical protein
MTARRHSAHLVGAAIWLLGVSLMPIGCGGDDDAAGGVRYSTLDYPAAGGDSTLLTGVRGVDDSSEVYISAFYAPAGSSSGIAGLIYKGATSGGGTWHSLTYPSSSGVTVTSTALYGPDNGAAGGLSVVGNITTAEAGDTPIGALYQGPLDGSGRWRTITPPLATATIAHSNMAGLAVGNYESGSGIGAGKAFVYDIDADSYTELVKPGAVSITAYGIWHNGGASYTIAGGYAEIGIASAYLVDWDSDAHTASNWKSYRFKDQPQPITLLSHFEGITTDGAGGYNLAADSILVESGVVTDAALANVPRNRDGSFGDATWTAVAYPNSTVTSANTVYQKDIIGVYQAAGSAVSHGYVAMID